ncbi:MAG: hypothetical protein ACTSQG_02805 [Promethearchaeota archaeon]
MKKIIIFLIITFITLSIFAIESNSDERRFKYVKQMIIYEIQSAFLKKSLKKAYENAVEKEVPKEIIIENVDFFKG